MLSKVYHLIFKPEFPSGELRFFVRKLWTFFLFPKHLATPDPHLRNGKIKKSKLGKQRREKAGGKSQRWIEAFSVSRCQMRGNSLTLSCFMHQLFPRIHIQAVMRVVTKWRCKNSEHNKENVLQLYESFFQIKDALCIFRLHNSFSLPATTKVAKYSN